jgi:DNA-binding MarR family transcriptional regulator
MLGDRMADATESEYRLLNAMSDTTQYSLLELVESSGVKREQVGRLLAELIREGYVTKYEQGGHAEYRLSPTGVGKRMMIRGLAKDGPIGMSDYLKAASTAQYYAGLATNRERMATEPLTDQERSICEDSLTAQHQQIRFGWAELTRRRALLTDAVTHGQLLEVFDGLQLPPLYGEQLAAPTLARRHSIGSDLRIVWLLVCLIIFLTGVQIAKDAANPGDYGGAAMFIGLSIVLAYGSLRHVITNLRSSRSNKPPQ